MRVDLEGDRHARTVNAIDLIQRGLNQPIVQNVSPKVVAQHPAANLIAHHVSSPKSHSTEIVEACLAELARIGDPEYERLGANKPLVLQSQILLPTHEIGGAFFHPAALNEQIATERVDCLLEGLKSSLPDAWTAFISIVRAITFVEANIDVDIPYFSGSSTDIWGAMHMIYTDRPDIFLECLTHEAAHHWLGLIELSGADLVENFWTNEYYVSPWRADLRPLGGMFHGVFVFSSVAVALGWMHQAQMHDVSNRLSYVCAQIRDAGLQLNTFGKLTELGSRVVAESIDRIDCVEATLAPHVLATGRDLYLNRKSQKLDVLKKKHGTSFFAI